MGDEKERTLLRFFFWLLLLLLFPPEEQELEDIEADAGVPPATLF